MGNDKGISDYVQDRISNMSLCFRYHDIHLFRKCFLLIVTIASVKVPS